MRLSARRRKRPKPIACGAAALVNLGELAYKVALMRDFVRWHPVIDVSQLANLEWLDRA